MQGYNPMYNNYGSLYSGQPLSNPMMGYQERMAQLQQQYGMPQQAPQQYMQPMSGLPGKVVDSLEVVKATDIPMDGNCYYFPKADGSEVYVKRWLANGTTEVATYKPFNEKPVVEEPALDMRTFCCDVTNKLDGIDERISKLEKSLSSKGVSRGGNKKEDGE